MYPTVKFVIDTKLDFGSLLKSLNCHYYTQYFKRLQDDFISNDDNRTVHINNSIIEFFGDIEGFYLKDLEKCLQTNYDISIDENRNKYFECYFTYRTLFNKEINKTWFLLFKSHRLNP
ncbi:hypothetical protein ACLH3R_002331 [Flavobacterium psychrophilum]